MGTFPTDWERRGDITTVATKINSNETDFPFYVDLSLLPADFWNNVQSDGGDIRVTIDEAGTTQLPLEVVFIDTTAQTGEIHFKENTDSTTNKTFYIWYRNSGSAESQPVVTDTYGRNNVWTSYDAVYHLEETSGSVIDSTGNNDGTNSGATTGVMGSLGKGYDFNGSNSKVAIPSTLETTTTQHTHSVWTNLDNVTKFQDFIGFGNSGNFIPMFRSGMDNAAHPIFFYRDNANQILQRRTTNTISSNTDYKLDFTWDASTEATNIFINGFKETLVDVLVNSVGIATINTGHLGALQRTSFVDLLDGTMSEVRIALSILSDGWLSTEYNMQSSNSTFWSVGTFEAIETATELTESLFFSDVLKKTLVIEKSESVTISDEVIPTLTKVFLESINLLDGDVRDVTLSFSESLNVTDNKNFSFAFNEFTESLSVSDLMESLRTFIFDETINVNDFLEKEGVFLREPAENITITAFFGKVQDKEAVEIINLLDGDFRDVKLSLGESLNLNDVLVRLQTKEFTESFTIIDNLSQGFKFVLLHTDSIDIKRTTTITIGGARLK